MHTIGLIAKSLDSLIIGCTYKHSNHYLQRTVHYTLNLTNIPTNYTLTTPTNHSHNVPIATTSKTQFSPTSFIQKTARPRLHPKIKLYNNAQHNKIPDHIPADLHMLILQQQNPPIAKTCCNTRTTQNF